MEVTNVVSFNWTIIMQLINTLVICVVLGKLLAQPIHNFVKKRQDAIDASLDQAEKKNQEALDLKREYEHKIRMAQRESRDIISAAKVKADNRSREIINEADRQADELKRMAELEIEREKNRTIHEAKEQIVSMAVFMAEKILEKELDEQEQREFINRILKEVGKTDV